MSAVCSRDWVRAQLADLLEVDSSAIADDDDLLDHGLDSMRVMVMLESWRSQGVSVEFVDVVSAPATVAAWAELADRARRR